MSVPNLDCMSRDELRAFWQRWHRPTKAAAVAFIGARKNARKIVETLACYAISKAAAIGCRQSGDIKQALACEESCQLAYERLPEDIRW